MRPYGGRANRRECACVQRKQGRQISLAYQCWRMARRHLRPRIMGSSRCRGGVRVEWRPAKGTLAERSSGGRGKKKGFRNYRRPLWSPSTFAPSAPISTNCYRIREDTGIVWVGVSHGNDSRFWTSVRVDFDVLVASENYENFFSFFSNFDRGIVF